GRRQTAPNPLVAGRAVQPDHLDLLALGPEVVHPAPGEGGIGQIPVAQHQDPPFRRNQLSQPPLPAGLRGPGVADLQNPLGLGEQEPQFPPGPHLVSVLPEDLHGLPTYLQARILALKVAQVVELGPEEPAVADHLDLLDARRVDGKDPLHPHAAAHLPDGDGLAQPRTIPGQDHALKDLDPPPVALDHPEVHLDRVAGHDLRQVVSHLGLLNLTNPVHHLHLTLPNRSPSPGWAPGPRASVPPKPSPPASGRLGPAGLDAVATCGTAPAGAASARSPGGCPW